MIAHDAYSSGQINSWAGDTYIPKGHVLIHEEAARHFEINFHEQLRL